LSEISLASIARIVKNIDPAIRIGVETKIDLREKIEDYANRVAELAISITRNANRNTILPQDIITACEQLMIGIHFHQTQVTQ